MVAALDAAAGGNVVLCRVAAHWGPAPDYDAGRGRHAHLRRLPGLPRHAGVLAAGDFAPPQGSRWWVAPPAVGRGGGGRGGGR